MPGGRPSSERKLTAKQERFVEEYLVDLNATQAAIRAGYSASNAGKIGPELIGKTRIQEALDSRRQKAAKATDVTPERVLRELALIGFANADDFFDWSPEGITIRDKDDLPRELRAVVAEVSQTTTQHGGSVRVKLHDKLAALEKIGRHLAMFTDRHEHTGKDGRAIEIADATDRDRAKAMAALMVRAKSVGGPEGA